MGPLGVGVLSWPSCRKSMRRPAIGKNDTSSSWFSGVPCNYHNCHVAASPVGQNTSGHHQPVSPPQGLCVDQEVPETTEGLLWAPGLLALPGIAALSPWGVVLGGNGVLCSHCGMAAAGGSQGGQPLLTDGQHEKREDAHHVPQTHVPEHHRLLGQRGRLGLGWGCAGLWVGREQSEPGRSQGLGLG